PDDRAILEALLAGDAPRALSALLQAAGWSGIERAVLPNRTALPPAEVGEAVAVASEAGVVRAVGDRLFHTSIYDAAVQLVLEAVEQVHAAFPLRAGADRDELRRALPRHAPPELADHVLARLIEDGTLEPARAALRRAGYAPTLTADQKNAIRDIATQLAAAGLAPPTTTELAVATSARNDLTDLLRLLEEDGTAVALRHDLYVSGAALAAAVERLRSQQPTGGEPLTPAAFREIFGISRKHLIPLLEYLDRAGVTVRHGDARTVKPL
ncbi:MAG: SelB C-terminal domain-containing protein, partial [Longimicrobiales bacterium]